MSCEKCYYSYRYANKDTLFCRCQTRQHVNPYETCVFDTTCYTENKNKNEKICLYCKYCAEMTRICDISLNYRLFLCYKPTGIRHNHKVIRPDNKACEFYKE